jgi:hypothetical protein
MEEKPNTNPKANEPSPTESQCPSYTAILKEHDIAEGQRQSRRGLLRKIGSKEFNNGKVCGVVSHITKEGVMGSGLESLDIPILGNILRQIGDVDVLVLILHSPGGDGTCVEKFVALCRNQCKHFRVVIPNMAKSAATMIALGADQIIMGPPSELGPIDAQVPVVIAGMPKYISAQSFIDARDTLLEKYKEMKAKKEDARPILQMIASLDIAHIEECQRMMDFGRDVVRKLLTKHMFHRERKRAVHIDRVVKMLSSVKTHMVHGRQIDGATARRKLGLNIRLLAKDDKLWQLIWEYYTRADVALGNLRSPKMFETEHETLSCQVENR